MSGQAPDVLVIGGGLHGLSAALHLARAGRRVAIVERSWAGRHASGATAAGVRTLRRDPAEIPLSLAAMAMWHRMPAIVGDDCGFHAGGQLCVAETTAQLAGLEARAALVRSLGHDHEELVDGTELRRLVPALARHCVGALLTRRDGAADPHRTLQAFRRSAEQAGVAIREGAAVVAIERTGGGGDGGWNVVTAAGRVAAPVVVNAAGAWGARIAAMVGDDIPLATRVSMMIATERVAPLLAPVVSAAGRSLSFKQTDRGTLLVGGGLQGRGDLDSGASQVDMAALARGAQAAVELFPAVRGVRIARTWAGLEAQTPDRLPVIGWSPAAAGVMHVFGFSGHGFQLVPAVGAAVAGLVVHGRTDLAVAAFAPGRLQARRVAA